MTTLEILQLGRERIAKGWCQKKFASDAAGHATSSTSEKACCWCMAGALELDITYTTDPLRDFAQWLLSRAVDNDLSVVEWNDTTGRTQAEVLAAFDRAIEMAKTYFAS